MFWFYFLPFERDKHFGEHKFYSEGSKVHCECLTQKSYTLYLKINVYVSSQIYFTSYVRKTSYIYYQTKYVRRQIKSPQYAASYVTF